MRGVLGACLIVVGFLLFSTWAKKKEEDQQEGGGATDTTTSDHEGLEDEHEPILGAARRANLTNDSLQSYDSLGESPVRSPQGFLERRQVTPLVDVSRENGVDAGDLGAVGQI